MGVDGLIFWMDILKNTFIVILILTNILVAFYIINRYYIDKTEDKFSGDKYVAVVLTNKSCRDKIMVYLSGVMFLVMYLKKNEKPYKLMKKFDINKFNEFIYDINCQGLYILGHGARDRLKVGNELIYYSEFKDAPKKDFIEQLHCNNGDGESLADIIAPTESTSFVSNGYRYAGENFLYFIHLYQPSLKMLIVLLPVIFVSEITDWIAKISRAFITFFINSCKYNSDECN